MGVIRVAWVFTNIQLTKRVHTECLWIRFGINILTFVWSFYLVIANIIT